MSALSITKSAVLTTSSRHFLKYVVPIIYQRYSPYSSTPHTNAPADKTMSWQECKEKYLSMSVENKRKEYRCGEDFYTLKDIATWPEYAKASEGKLAKRIDALPGVQIDASLNETLAQKVSLFRGDITTLEVDAIVNAANKSLRGGMGVDGAIHRGAGPLLLKENITLNGCNVGEAKITGGYKLPAKYVIATVGPQGEKPDLLKQCYKNSMELLLSKGLRTIAFPCISTGVYGYPLVPAAHVAIGQVRSQLEKNVDKVDRVVFCLFSEEDEKVYQGVMQSYFPTK